MPMIYTRKNVKPVEMWPIYVQLTMININAKLWAIFT